MTTPSSPYVYAAKFLCGLMPELSEPTEGPVEPGSYTSAINIHNPNAKPVNFVKKAILLYEAASTISRAFETPREPSPRMTAELGPDWGLELDGRDIRLELLGGQAPPAPTFIKGWVVIESPGPLDVVAVYTVRADGSVGIATDRVIPTRF